MIPACSIGIYPHCQSSEGNIDFRVHQSLATQIENLIKFIGEWDTEQTVLIAQFLFYYLKLMGTQEYLNIFAIPKLKFKG